MTTTTTTRRLSSFADLAEAYREMTATPEFQLEFGPEMNLAFRTAQDERQDAEIPDPLAAQHVAHAILAEVFDLFHDTSLQASAQAIAWGIVNAFHHEAQKLERYEDDAAYEVRELDAEADGGEISNTKLETAQLKCATYRDARAAIESMRDDAASAYHSQTGFAWSPARGTKASATTTASQIAARDFLAARAADKRARHNPAGPVVVLSGGQEWHDWEMLWERLDEIKARVPHMVLCTTAQRRGVDAIGASWAAKRGVPIVAFTLQTSLGRRAPFARNKKLADLKPVEAIVAQGSGIQQNLYDTLRTAGVPIHAFAAAMQRRPDAPPTPRDRLRAAAA